MDEKEHGSARDHDLSADAATASAAATFDQTTASRLRTAAMALEAWEKVRDWRSRCDRVTDSQTQVSWRFAASTNGYDLVAAEVGQLIGEELGEHISRALDRIEHRARHAYESALLPPAAAIAKARGQ